MSKLEIMLLVLAFGLLIFTVEIVRRRRLSENYAIAWMLVALVGVLLGLARPLVDRLSQSLGIAYGTSLVFALAILFLVGVCINLSMHVSRLESRLETLAREAAFLRGPMRPDHARPDRERSVEDDAAGDRDPDVPPDAGS
ncbi:MAG: DUF2304 domain-containing protein [Acidimicrobiales bacterium]